MYTFSEPCLFSHQICKNTQVINAPSSGLGLKGFLEIYFPNSELMIQNEGDIPLK